MTITINNTEYTAVTAILASAGETNRRNAVYVHDLDDTDRNGDLLAFDYDLPADEGDAENILTDVNCHTSDSADLATIRVDGNPVRFCAGGTYAITINGTDYTASHIWYAVQRNSADAWDNGSEDYDTAVEMLRAQGHGLIAIIDDDAKVCLGEILYSDLFDDEETLYILRDLDGYGNATPVCVDRAEAEELMRGWYATDSNAPAFDDVWRVAESRDLKLYGIA